MKFSSMTALNPYNPLPWLGLLLLAWLVLSVLLAAKRGRICLAALIHY